MSNKFFFSSNFNRLIGNAVTINSEKSCTGAVEKLECSPLMLCRLCQLLSFDSKLLSIDELLHRRILHAWESPNEIYWQMFPVGKREVVHVLN